MTPSPLGSRTTLRVVIIRLLCTIGLVCAATLPAQAQITSTSDATQTPVAGAGHDYLHMINESVNPEIGTVSLSIGVPMPPGRKLNLPFSFQYSSGGALFLVPSWSLGWGAQWTNNQGPLATGGWSYAFPSVSRVSKTYTIPPPPAPPSPDGSTTCSTTLGYTFVDANGTQHNLYMSHVFNNYPTQYNGNNYPVNYACTQSQYTSEETDTGGDSIVLSNLFNVTSCQLCLGPSDGTFTVADPDGTVYAFAGFSYPTPQGSSYPQLLGGLEDRNGNTLGITYTLVPHTLNVGGFTITDTLARPVVSATNFGQGSSNVTVDGLSNPYTATWSTVNYNGYTINTQNIGQDYGGCAGSSGQFPGQAGSESVITSLALPNGQSYQFTYDSTYGTLTKITYPTGGYVSYTYGINPLSTTITSTNSNLESSCEMYIDTAAVIHRYVSFDGSTNASRQDFTYSTTQNGTQWSSKTTTVNTYYDLIHNPSSYFKTVYTYAPVAIACGPNGGGLCSDVGVERSIAYYDTSSNLLETVTKGWYDQYREACEFHQTGASGAVSAVFYTYSAQGGQVTDKKEYTYGQIAASSINTVCPAVGTPAPPSNPARETATAYQTFTNNATILDRPCQVILYDYPSSTKTREAETDYFYDSTPTTNSPCGTATTQALQAASTPPGTHDETNYGPTKTPPRGNLTGVVKQCFQGGTSCASGNPTTSYIYDETGQILSTTDPRNNTTTFSYTDSYSSCSGAAPPDGSTNAYLTQITYPQTGSTSHLVKFCYGYNDGQLRGSTDQNTQTTTYKYGTKPSGCASTDLLDRVSEIDYPDGGVTTYCFNDSPYNPSTPSPSVTTTKVMNSSQSIISVDAMDGVGHSVETELTDPQGTIYTKTVYDGLGRTYTVTNPYRTTGDPTYGLTTYAYDSLSRTTSVTKPDNSVVTTVYCNAPPSTLLTSSVKVTDEAGHWRRSETDALGRLVEVDEPNSTTATVNVCPGTGEPIWVTTYTYDALNDLIGAVQGGSRNRSFTYNSIKQLTQSTNPESGTIKYTYDANGNVTTKVDARNITTNYSPTASPIDALNRVTEITYSDGMTPTVNYTYDQSACLGQSSCYNIGHRTTMTDAGGSENLAYDKMGRGLAEQRVTNSITKTTTYSYDKAGDLATLTYPTGRIITYTYDSTGRPSEAQDVANSINYALGTCANGLSSNGVCYAPQGAVSQIKNGTNLISTYLFNTRLQPCWMYATTGTALATSTLCTATDSTPGNILDLKYCFYTWSSGACQTSTTNNGNVIGITNNRTTARTQTFTYDQVNRIVTGETTSTTGSNCWGETYTLDQWANLTAIGAVSGYTGCTQENLSVSVNANNQLSSSGFTYDSAGNLTFTPAPGAGSYTYNAESQLVQSAVFTEAGYIYDGDGNRLAKTNGVQVTKIYWYGAGTEILDESDQSGNFTNEYVFFGGKRIAMRTVSTGTIYYYEEDMLGSSRTIVQAGQTSPCYDADFYPFGGERVVTNTCSQNYKFEGKERDTETNNDDFGARYYSSQYGRWLSADWSSVPAPVPYANLTNPQTLNLYAMVSDNPESFADLDGHYAFQTPLEFITGCAADLKGCPDQQSSSSTSQNTNAAGAITSSTKPTENKPAQANAAVQVAKDTVVGGAKEAANTVIDLANLINAPIDAGLAKLGINFSFGQGTELSGSTPGEKGAMTGLFILSFFTPAGEEKAAATIERLTADAEKAYPKLAGKLQDHHIIPQYLGGAKDGATSRIPAAYHQLITNEFRALAPYGQKIQRSAEEVGRILQQVYSKYPLPW
jgi:RHS repeat-associated protein